MPVIGTPQDTPTPTPTPPPGSAYPDLLAAIVAWFRGDPDLMGAFPGGIVLTRAGAASAFPYCLVTARRIQPGLSLDDRQYMVGFSCYAVSDDEAASVSATLRRKVEAEDRDRFLFTDEEGDWLEASLLEMDADGPEVRGTTKDGSPLWRNRMPYEVRAIGAS